MKLEITGRVDVVGGVQPLKKGFQQRVVLEQPQATDEFDRVTRYAEYYTITIYSTSQTDSRFLSSKDMRSVKKASVYLKGERWFNEAKKEFNYNHKLNLNQWQS
jgi:hypothetical protein